MSQAPKTRSSSLASGTKSWTRGTRFSVRLPRRTVPICVSEPIGFPSPPLTPSTPAMEVGQNAPQPPLDRLDAGDEGGRDRPQADQQHSQLPFRRLDVNALLAHGDLLWRHTN